MSGEMFPPDIQKVRGPLVIGVTGHRDLRPEDRDRLSEAVRNILRGLREKYRFTPLIMLSPLAEGADRLVARVALEPEIGARLVVPLPMPRRLYEQDFESTESLEEFQKLLREANAEDVFEMPMLASEDEVGHRGEARDRQYEEVGKYIARESQILIALWDGIDSGKVGGTSTIVSFQLQGIKSRRQTEVDLEPLELFPVYHIVTPRKPVYQIVTPRESHPDAQGEPFQLNKRYPQGFNSDREAEEYYATIFRRLDEFNSCILNDKSTLQDATQSKKDLLRGFDQANLSEKELLDLDRYAAADALARRFQGNMLRVHRALHWLVFGAFTFFVLFAHLPRLEKFSITEKSPYFLLAASLLLLITYLVQRYSRRQSLDTRRQDYRAIAEGCRVRFVWHLAGIHESVADNYLGKQRTELDWIRNGLRGWEIGTDTSAPDTPLSTQGLEAVRRLWIDAQFAYFPEAIKRNEKKSETMETLVLVCGILLLFGLAVLWMILGCGLAESESKVWTDGLIIAVDLLLAAGALLHHATHQRAYAQIIKQFQRMKSVFAAAIKLIDEKEKAKDFQGVQQCISRLGKEALAENGDWVLLHRERPLELPHP